MILPQAMFNVYHINPGIASDIWGSGESLLKMAEDFPVNMLDTFYKDDHALKDRFTSVSRFIGVQFSLSDPFNDDTDRENLITAITKRNFSEVRATSIIKSLESPYYAMCAALESPMHECTINNDFVLKAAVRSLSRFDGMINDVIHHLKEFNKDHANDHSGSDEKIDSRRHTMEINQEMLNKIYLLTSQQASSKQGHPSNQGKDNGQSSRESSAIKLGL